MGQSARTDRLFATLTSHGSRPAIAEAGLCYSYQDLLGKLKAADDLLDRSGIQAGQVIGVQSDFTLAAIAMTLALFRRGCVAAFISSKTADPAEQLHDACAAGLFTFPSGEEPVFEGQSPPLPHRLLDRLTTQHKAGFIIFSSGSSGRPKAILHDLEAFLAAYDRRTKAMTTLAFLLFDHVAGLDTLLYTLHAGGCLVLVGDRNPNAVCDLISRWSVEVLPVSPSFLKLLCLSGAAEGAALGSLRIITFGSEPMDETTLQRVSETFPNVQIRQKYGASEFGAPAARTRQDNGLWIRLDSDGVKVRVIEDILWLKAPTTMLGYLNADLPPMEDGWICTGDRVEIDGEWMRILGRQSDLINVGGEKVFPSEVEAVISELQDVAEVAVSGERHPMVGEVVTALVRPVHTDADQAELRALVRSHCLKRLTRYKVPTKISFTSNALFNDRQKVLRRSPAAISSPTIRTPI